MKSGLLCAVMTSAMLVASAAHSASVFSLNWSSTSGQSTTDATMKAIGTLEIGVGDGETFGIQDLISINVDVMGEKINDFTIDGSENTTFLFGRISDNGLFATLSDFLFANIVDPFIGNGFGCDFDDPEVCAQGNFDGGPNYNIVSGRLMDPTNVNGNKGTTTYASPGRALGSISLTRVFDDPDPVDPDPGPIDPGPGPLPPPNVIPLPATAPLLLGALAGLAFWRRRKAS
ncbi:MAG: VPLPA-CTERM sorting domain-containing protein [Pseudomonadota bacterium]